MNYLHKRVSRNKKLPTGGFGLAEDDLTYQMVVENLKEKDHSNRNSRHDEEDVDD